jgi:hypothetical protein
MGVESVSVIAEILPRFDIHSASVGGIDQPGRKTIKNRKQTTGIASENRGENLIAIILP